MVAQTGTGSILYAGSVRAGNNVEAGIAQRGDILYIGKVEAGNDVIARTAVGDIFYFGSVEAGHNVVSSTGKGRIGYLGSVMAGKDLPEQIRSGQGKIAYYDRYGLIGYSDALNVVPVRNATQDELDIDEEQQ